jgi:hypothetical protein
MLAWLCGISMPVAPWKTPLPMSPSMPSVTGSLVISNICISAPYTTGKFTGVTLIDGVEQFAFQILCLFYWISCVNFFQQSNSTGDNVAGASFYDMALIALDVHGI